MALSHGIGNRLNITVQKNGLTVTSGSTATLPIKPILTDASGKARTVIGIVFVVNTDGKTGKIVGLTEAKEKKWGIRGRDEKERADGINSTTDGATATKNLIKA